MLLYQYLIEDTLQQLIFDFKYVENEFFDAKTKNETKVSPMWGCIKLWLKNTLIKITEPNQQK
jgi:hypothetical protein